MKKTRDLFFIPIYYLIVSVLFPIQFYVNNAYLFKLPNILIVIVLVVLFSLITTFLLSFVVSKNHAPLIMFFLLIITFFPGLSVRNGLILTLILIVLSIVMLRVMITRNMHFMLNVFSVFLLFFQLYSLALLSLQKKELSDVSELSQMKRKPDIYHFVLDGYNNKNALSDYYDYDNSVFLFQLEEFGFEVYNEAISPYNQTLPIISSMFNLDYIIDENNKSSLKPLVLLSNWGTSPYTGIVPTYLLQNGYHFAYTSSGYSFIKFPEAYDVKNISATNKKRVNHFSNEFLTNLWWFSLFKSNRESGLYDLAINAFSDRSYAKLTKPFFYYSHILSPHPPFNVDKNGNRTGKFINFNSINDGSHATKMEPDLIAKYKSGYLAKLEFTNSQVLNQLKYIIDHMQGDKIIIVQGDHGGGSAFHHDELSKTCVSERFKPLLAIYKEKSSEDGTVERPYSLVNIYRDILSELSDNSFPELPVKTYFIPWGRPSSIDQFNIEEREPCQ